MSLRSQLRVVLHQVRSPGNLGSVARLMANFELAELVLSDPHTFELADAGKMAVKAAPVLEKVVSHPDLGAALEGCVFALGTSSREGAKGQRVLTPEEGVALLAEQSARGKVALVFGGEKRGLSDADLAHCQAMVAIPTGNTQPSMNLAQAAAVLLYLCGRQELTGQPRPAAEPGARLETVAALERRMEAVLVAAGFLNPQAPEHILRELLRTLTRVDLTQREVELWLAAFKQLERVGPKPA